LSERHLPAVHITPTQFSIVSALERALDMTTKALSLSTSSTWGIHSAEPLPSKMRSRGRTGEILTLPNKAHQ
jgi:hypothetical protein